MMKRSLVFMMGLLFALSAADARAISLMATPGSGDVNPGDTVDVTVQIMLGADQASALDLAFEVQGTAPGSIAIASTNGADWPSPTTFVAGNRASFSLTSALGANNTGTVQIAVLTLGVDASASPGSVLDLVVANASGSADLDVPPFFAVLDFTGIEGSTIASLNVVPEPGTVFLLGLGLTSLALYGRRRNREE